MFFDFFKRNSIQNLTNKSSNVISLFTKTIKSLNELNEKIDGEIDNKSETIRNLTQEVQTLDDLKIANDKIISKVKQIIE